MWQQSEKSQQFQFVQTSLSCLVVQKRCKHIEPLTNFAFLNIGLSPLRALYFRMPSQNQQFALQAPYQPAGDQGKVIQILTESLLAGNDEQTLLGVTGSGKTFIMASIIQNLQRPTLVIAHNKTLAAQLAEEFQKFFPNNAVHYFVSYYDYYQPESYIPKAIPTSKNKPKLTKKLTVYATLLHKPYSPDEMC